MTNASDKPVLVVGDIINDVHHFGIGGGISREASIPVGLHERTVSTWGGAGLVVRNLLALRKPTIFVSILGSDAYGEEMARFADAGLTKVFVAEEGRATMVKERFLINGAKVLRWNRGDSRPMSLETESKVEQAIEEVLPVCDKVLLSDYRHGCLTETLVRRILESARNAGKAVFVDSQVTRTSANHGWYKGADLICLNEDEARAVDPSFTDAEYSLQDALIRLKQMLSTQTIIVKRGGNGSASLVEDEYILTPPKKVEVIDTTGAGDAFFAALGSRSKVSLDSLRFANDWAGDAVTIMGTVPPSLSDVT